MAKPTKTNSPSKANEKALYKKALRSLQEARAALNAIAALPRDAGFTWADVGTATKFAADVGEIISSDNGECGILAIVDPLYI